MVRVIRAHRITLFGALACAGAACSILTSDEGLTRVATDAESEDANANDALVAADARSDDVVPGDAGTDGEAGPFCESLTPKPYFCVDFDEGEIGDGWSQVVTKADASIVVFDDVATSPARAARMRVDPHSPNCTYAALDRDFVELDASSAHFETNVRIGERDASPSALSTFAYVAFKQGDATCALIAYTTPEGTAIVAQNRFDGGPFESTRFDLLRDIAPGKYARLTIDVTRNPPTFNAALDGQPALGTAVALDSRCTGSGHPYVRVGIHCQDDTADPTEVRIDDVVFDVQ